MAKALFSEPHFQSEEAARALIEGVRWPEGPFCGHCGSLKKPYATSKAGRYRCAEKECRKDFTVTTGMVMESSHIKLHLWLQAFHLAASSKKGFSANQLKRELGVTYKSAWFMEHRVREAMREGGLGVPMGGAGKIVEADETYYGPKKIKATKTTSGRPYTKTGGNANKRIIVTLVERGGKARSFHIPRADKATVSRIVTHNVDKESRLHTDEARVYQGADQYFASHETTNHRSGEYARGDVHSNTAEGYFSVFKRGMRGVYQHCSEKHLHRYLAEFDFRFNRREALGYTDDMRTMDVVAGAVGKRLLYKKPH